MSEPEPTLESARQFVEAALAGFVADPPESDVQRGYLEALYVIGTEALGMDFGPAAPIPPTRLMQVPYMRVVK